LHTSELTNQNSSKVVEKGWLAKMPPPTTRPRKSAKPEKEKSSSKPSSTRSSKSKKDEAPAEESMDFPKCEGDGYHDTADAKLIKKVLDSPTETDGHINVAVRVNIP
jgi:hypothetical protein